MVSTAQEMTKMREASKAAMDARVAQGLPALRSLAEKFADKPTFKAAISAMCEQCMGGARQPGVRDGVRNCTDMACPLRMYRPYQ